MVLIILQVAFQSTESFDAFCVGKRSFAFEFITVEPIKHQVLRQLVRGDFNLRHVNPPIEKKTCVVANVQLPGELFREIVNKKVILRHVVTTVKRGKVCVQPARRDVEEAMWSRIRNGPSAIEVLYFALFPYRVFNQPRLYLCDVLSVTVTTGSSQ